MWLMWKGWKADTLTLAFHWSKSRNYELSVVYILNGGENNFVVKKSYTNDKKCDKNFFIET